MGHALRRPREASGARLSRFRLRPGWCTRGGQTLVEFALVFPIFMMLLMSVIEFAFIFNATLATNFASRNAAFVGAESGANTLADCAILAQVEQNLGAPNNPANIQSVTIYRADRAGNPVSGAQNVYAGRNHGLAQGSRPAPFRMMTLRVRRPIRWVTTRTRSRSLRRPRRLLGGPALGFDRSARSSTATASLPPWSNFVSCAAGRRRRPLPDVITWSNVHAHGAGAVNAFLRRRRALAGSSGRLRSRAA